MERGRRLPARRSTPGHRTLLRLDRSGELKAESVDTNSPLFPPVSWTPTLSPARDLAASDISCLSPSHDAPRGCTALRAGAAVRVAVAGRIPAGEAPLD